MGFGLVILYFYLFPTPENQAIRSVFLQWAVTLSAVALVVGMINLFAVHARKVSNESTDWFNSSVLIISLALTFLIVLFRGPDDGWSRFIFSSIQVPIELSLMAVLAVSLAYASARLLRKRPTWLSIVFVITALVILAGTSPFITNEIPIIGEALYSLRGWISRVPATAGARGILLGVGLGTITTGLRILLGTDRPYGG